MAQQQQQGGGSSVDSGLAPLWITLLLFITVGLVWYYGHAYIVSAVFAMKSFEGHVANFFTRNMDDVLLYIKTVPAEEVTWNQLYDASSKIGLTLRYPIIAIMAVMAIWLYFSNVVLRFRRTHNMKTLREQEQKNWPQIMPVIKLDLTNTDISQGPWAMGLSPMEFARKHDLLKRDEFTGETPQIQGYQMTAAIKKGEAKRLFTLQLGPYWEGPASLKGHYAVLFAAFAAKLNRDRNASIKILEQLNKSAALGKLDFSGANQLIKKHINTEDVQRIVQGHAYLLTVMASMLDKSRIDGVLPTSEFLWLKPVDRRLWYMLNSVGRQTPYSEVAGAFAHWTAEKALGRKSMVPMVDEAVKALAEAVKEIKLTPKEMEAL